MEIIRFAVFSVLIFSACASSEKEPPQRRKTILPSAKYEVGGVYQESGDCNHDSKNFRCVHYVSNYDGDTIKFMIPRVHPIIGDKISVRVAGVDTPELRTKDRCEKEKGLKAKSLVGTALRSARQIHLKNIKRGKYFRIVADVQFIQKDGVEKTLKDLLIDNGLAVKYEGGKKARVDWCQAP